MLSSSCHPHPLARGEGKCVPCGAPGSLVCADGCSFSACDDCVSPKLVASHPHPLLVSDPRAVFGDELWSCGYCKDEGKGFFLLCTECYAAMCTECAYSPPDTVF